jgi:hypothetical protein
MRLVLFVTIFLAVYLGMHLLVFWGMRPLLAGFSAGPRWLALWMALMLPLPLLIRPLERFGFELLARGVAWVGYLWMGLLFLAFAGCVVVAGGELLARLAVRLQPTLAPLALHGAATAAMVVGIAVAASLYGLYEARTLRVERVTIHSARRAADAPTLRIVQISDLHLGLLQREAALQRVVAAIRELRPDLLVATGDIVDAQIDHLDGLSRLFAELDVPLGKFAVTGNHEYYAGLKPALNFLQRSGFTVLRGTTVYPVAGLAVTGVDDPTGGGSDEGAALPALHERFTVLLKHRPLVDARTRERFDLQLSGHAHRGQIFPFNLLTGLSFPMQDGLYDLGGGTQLYTSRGTGTWGPPLRVLSPPEVTLFEIVGSAPAAAAAPR